MLGSDFGAVEKAVSYILSQPDGKRSRGIADLRGFADRIVSPLSVCEKTGGVRRWLQWNCGSWKIFTEEWRILFLLGVNRCTLVEHGSNRLCHIHSPDGHLLAKRKIARLSRLFSLASQFGLVHSFTLVFTASCQFIDEIWA